MPRCRRFILILFSVVEVPGGGTEYLLYVTLGPFVFFYFSSSFSFFLF